MVSTTLRIWRSFAFVGLLLGFVPAVLAFTVPVNDGYVTDTTGTLTAQQDADLENSLKQYKDQTSNEIAVLIVPTLSGATLNEVGVQVGRKWGVGSKENNNGILMLIALQDREMGILTGYGMEGAVPDVVAKGIIDTDITPAFRDGRYFEGIKAGIESLEKHVGGEYKASRYEEPAWLGFGPGLLFILFIVIDVLAAFLGRSKSWWLGGVLGGVFGLILALIFGWWISIPILVVLGLIFDYVVSRMPKSPGGRGGGFWGGLGGGGLGGGRGGFGGFGGGSFGGGGASGKW